MDLLHLLARLGQHIPGVALAQGLGTANHIFEGQGPGAMPMQGDPRLQGGTGVQQAPLWNRHTPFPLQGSADTGEFSGLVQEPGNIPIGGFQHALNGQPFQTGNTWPVNRGVMNQSDFRDTQIQQPPQGRMQVNNRRNNQQIRI